jgi:hypothetical protein
MLPEGLVITLVVFPIYAHICEEVSGPSSRQDRGDIGVCSCIIAARVERTIAMVRPREESALHSLKAQNFAHQRPWTVHESTGPVAGEVSQNLYSFHQSISLHPQSPSRQLYCV